MPIVSKMKLTFNCPCFMYLYLVMKCPFLKMRDGVEGEGKEISKEAGKL